jgi:thiol:disulfide interchange protein
MLPAFSTDLAYSVAMLAALVLMIGGAWLIMKKRDARQGVLMIVMALVLIANVVIWTLPAGR